MNILENNRNKIREELPQPTLSSYAVCPLRWHGLSSLDYALLANLAYFDRRIPSQLVKIKQLLAALFPENMYGKVSIVEDFLSNSSPRVPLETDEPTEYIFKNFVQYNFQRLQLKVIAVQGTNPSTASECVSQHCTKGDVFFSLSSLSFFLFKYRTSTIQHSRLTLPFSPSATFPTLLLH